MTTELTLSQHQVATKRAAQIRSDLQQTAVLYVKAVTEQDWRVLGYPNVRTWMASEFGPDRFSAERRKEIVAMLTTAGRTQREIAAATGTSKSTVNNDQQEAGVSSETLAPRQQAARDRETRRRTQPPEPASAPGFIRDIGYVQIATLRTGRLRNWRAAYRVKPCEFPDCATDGPRIFDHCHLHGWVRGLFCGPHNIQLGVLDKFLPGLDGVQVTIATSSPYGLWSRAVLTVKE